jgi:hypothetical protein
MLKQLNVRSQKGLNLMLNFSNSRSAEQYSSDHHATDAAKSFWILVLTMAQADAAGPALTPLHRFQGQ